MTGDGTEKPDALQPVEPVTRRGPGGRQPGAGRKPTHGAAIMRRTLRVLTTQRLDGRSAIAVAVRKWKEDVRADLGGDLTRAQETILELTAQSWLVVSSLDDWINRQPSHVRKRQVLPVIMQREALADSITRRLDKLGLERKAKPVPSLAEYLAAHAAKTQQQPSPMTATDRAEDGSPAALTHAGDRDGKSGSHDGDGER